MLVFKNDIIHIVQDKAGYRRLILQPGPYPMAQQQAALQRIYPPWQRTGAYNTLLDARLLTPLSLAE